MVRRRKKVEVLEPYWYNEDIHLLYELKHGSETILPGTMVRIKSERIPFRFDRLVVNSKTGVEWIDVYDTQFGGWRSFYTSQLMGTFTAKKSRRKKIE